MKKILTLLTASLYCAIFSPECHPQKTYRLVNDQYQIDSNSKYILVAKDYNTTAGDITKKNGKYYLSSTDIIKNADNTINIGDNSDALIFEIRHKTSSQSVINPACEWRFLAVINGYTNGIVTGESSSDNQLGLEKDIPISIKHLSIVITPDNRAEMMFDNFPSKYIKYDFEKKLFSSQLTSDYGDVTLYRLDRFNFKIDENESSSDKIILTSSWEEEADYKYNQPISIYYLFNDGTPVGKDEIINQGKKANGTDKRVEIPRSTEFNTLWIIGEYRPPAADRVTYSHIFTANPAAGTKPTDSSHFTIPKSNDYKYKENVNIVRDNDVKIYYTLDGSEPIAPVNGAQPTPPTMDIDVTPVVYMGNTINLKFIAVKNGYSPSNVTSLTLTGESIPATSLNTHFKKPAEKAYAINEVVNFERDEDVKIYYTVDGSTPVYPDKSQGLSMGPNTYDLDNTPIIYKGSTLTVIYVAIKKDYLPSEVMTATISGELNPTLLGTHFKKPAAKSYAINETVIFERDEDVKIYYTLNGNPPQAPDKVNNTAMGADTYDVDNTPIIYQGAQLNVHFVAVKPGFRQSEVINVIITGEQRKTQLDVHFKKPAEKSYALNETVVFLHDNDVKIYYTIDGSTPIIPTQEQGTQMGQNTFDLDNTPLIYKGVPLTVKVIAVKKDYLPSDVITFTISGELNPTLLGVHFQKPANKKYALNETVVFERDEDVTIYYTIDGSNPIIPEASNGNTMGTNTFNIDITPIVYTGSQLNINFVAVKKGFSKSEVVTAVITGETNQTLLDVHFKKPTDKKYALNETVVFLRDTDVKIYYTLDGAYPVAPDKELSIPMGVSTYDLDVIPLVYKGKTLNVNFIAIKSGFKQSELVTVTIVGELNPTLIDVHFKKPVEKTYSLNESVTFLRDKDVKIYYTLDGSTPIAPDANGNTTMGENTFDVDVTPLVYTGTTLNVQFIAVKNGFGPSDVVSFIVTGELKPTLLDVHFKKPADKSYAINEKVIFLRDNDVKIYYTIDGSQPTIPTASVSSGATFDIDDTPLVYLGEKLTVNFIAIKKGFKASEVYSVTITGEAPPKTEINSHFYILKESNYKFKETVQFDKFNDVKIYYTIDGSIPVIPTDNISSPTTFDIDETPIVYMGVTITLKLIAVKTGLSPSDVITITLTGEPIPQTTINIHFKRPAEKVYTLNEPILFERDNDVKIYYTLDNQAPVVPQSSSIVNIPTTGNTHDGKTYDLDSHPLLFEGKAIRIKFIALKKDYLPSEVYDYSIESDASGIVDITGDDDNATPIYYNLQGIQVIPPLQPGLYIVKQGSKVSKTIIK